MMTNVFTYGSLMFPDVWERVVRGSYQCSPATVYGCARFAIAGETYPGMIEQADASVEGILYFDVDAADLAALDAFEGDDYRRVVLQAKLESGGTIEAGTYLYLVAARLTSQPWLPEAFQMQRFLGTYCRDKLGDQEPVQ